MSGQLHPKTRRLLIRLLDRGVDPELLASIPARVEKRIAELRKARKEKEGRALAGVRPNHEEVRP